MPASSEEVWRYVDLDFDLADFGLADTPGSALGGRDVSRDATRHVPVSTTSLTVSPIGGRRAELLGGVRLAPRGVDRHEEHSGRLRSRDPAGSRQVRRRPRCVRRRRRAPPRALGAWRERRPFYVDVRPPRPGPISFPRVTIVVEDGAEASVMVNYVTRRWSMLVVVPQIEIVGAATSPTSRVTGRAELGATHHGHRPGQIVGRAAMRLVLAEAGLGGLRCRGCISPSTWRARVRRRTIIGAYFGDRRPGARLPLLHASCRARTPSSDMFLKGAVEDEALSRLHRHDPYRRGGAAHRCLPDEPQPDPVRRCQRRSRCRTSRSSPTTSSADTDRRWVRSTRSSATT